MKTTHTLSVAIATFLFSFLHAENNSANSSLQIEILELKTPHCNGASDGRISVQAIGGESPYTYSWNTFPEQQGPIAYNLPMGIYFIQVTDSNGKVSFRSIELSDPITTTLEIGATAPTSTLTFEVNPVSDQTYSYFLNGEPISAGTIHDLDVGIHQLLIIDENQCAAYQYVQVFQYENDTIHETQTIAEATPLIGMEIHEEGVLLSEITMIRE